MVSVLKGRHVAVGVGGGIAAYKVADVVRELRRAGAEVKVAMTRAAQEFITPLTMQSLSGHPVLTDYFDVTQEENFGHLHLSRWADVYVVAPATADLLARLAAGQANDAVTTSLSAFRGPVVLAPAMNTAMWDNEATQRNLKTLLSQSRFSSVGPGVGLLADGDVGAGRLAELKDIVAAVEATQPVKQLSGKQVLITAGPTREFLDPVRFISNPSTGKMGRAMALEAARRGAAVTLVHGPAEFEALPGVEVVKVVTADEMANAVLSRVDAADLLIASAAVSDWRSAEVSTQKQKKHTGDETVKLVRTRDVLAESSQRIRQRQQACLVIGFAAETHDVEKYALEKMQRKQLDFIVANDVSREGQGFGADANAVTVLGRSGSRVEAAGSKTQVAAHIFDAILGAAR